MSTDDGHRRNALALLSAQDIYKEMDHIKTGLALYDNELNLVFANKTIRGYLPTLYASLDAGQTMEASILAQVKVIYPALDHGTYQKQAAYIYDMIKNSGTLEVTTPSGLKLNSSYDRTPSGAYIVTTTDVTERIKNEENLLRSCSAAESANQAKTEFLANMSHEIRTPLSGVLLASQLLQGKLQSLNTPELDQLASILVETTQHLSGVINNVLNLSKIEAGEVEINLSNNNLAQMLKSIIDSQKVIAAEKDIDLKFIVAPDIPQQLLYDETRVRQCVTNLVTNALKFTHQGHITLAAMMEPEDNRVIIHVADTGPGISPDKQAHIFGRFAQADHETPNTPAGTGLGLTISRKLAQLMGGDITLKSELKKGSVFSLSFITEPAPCETEVLNRAAS